MLSNESYRGYNPGSVPSSGRLAAEKRIDMDLPALTLPLRPLDQDLWAPFGWLPVADVDPRDGADTLTFEWHDPHVNLISHTADEVVHTNGALVCDRLFRHWTHTQALLVLDADCAIAVAAAGAEFTLPADLGQIHAFEVHPGDSLVLHRGTWHWGPFPLAADKVNLYNVQGRRYAEDNDCRLLSHLGAVLCGQPPPT
jgi:ureidoglycolate hydrolase